MLTRPTNPILARQGAAAELAGLLPGGGPTIRTNERHAWLQAARIDAAVEQLRRLPDDDETLHAIMDGRFHAWDVVPATIELAGCNIERLTCTTLGFNNRQAAQLADYLERGLVGAAAMVVSHMFWQQEKQTCLTVADDLRRRGGDFAVAQNHSKVLLIALEDGRRLVVESSANMRSCNALEQFSMANHVDLYEWHLTWILPLLDLPNPAHRDPRLQRYQAPTKKRDRPRGT